MRSPPRSILAATDLGAGSDAVVRAAALLAQRTGAELHLLHSLEFPEPRAAGVAHRPGFFGQIDRGRERLRDQGERLIPAGVRLASEEVIIYVARKATGGPLEPLAVEEVLERISESAHTPALV